jgi:hypothetical protein
LLSGSIVSSFSSPTDLSQLWFGFSNVTFDQIDINVTQNANGALLLDNLESNPAAPVPEPASLLLLGAGLFAAGLRRKRAAREQQAEL